MRTNYLGLDYLLSNSTIYIRINRQTDSGRLMLERVEARSECHDSCHLYLRTRTLRWKGQKASKIAWN